MEIDEYKTMTEMIRESDLDSARIILEELDAKLNINWNMEKYYLNAICEGLRKIRERRTEWAFAKRKEVTK